MFPDWRSPTSAMPPYPRNCIAVVMRGSTVSEAAHFQRGAASTYTVTIDNSSLSS